MKRGFFILILSGIVIFFPNCTTLKRSNALNNEGFTILQSGRYEEAQARFEEALKENPENPFALNNLGVIYEKKGNYQKALLMYEKAAQTGSLSTAHVEVEDPSLKGLSISELAKRNSDRLKGIIK